MTTNPYEDREQTEVKHKLLERYLSGAIPILGSWASDIAYIDCLAGPWQSAAADLHDTSFARAISVLRDTKTVLRARGKFPTFRSLLLELQPDAYEKLHSFCARITDLEVRTENWDFSERIPDIVEYVHQRARCFPFFFIDPTGWELAAIPHIRPLLEVSPGEVLINLMTSWITRFLSDPTKPFEDLLGSGEAVQRLRTLKGHEQEEELVHLYAEEIRHTGAYKYVCTLPIMKSGSDAFHFYMVYGTRHEKGVEVFKQTEKSVVEFMHSTRAIAQHRRELELTGQLTFLAPEATYREHRYSRFRLKNLAIVKNRAEAKLRDENTLDFDELWADWMQYATVIESDLQDWISEMVSRGRIAVSNMAPRQRILHRGQNHQIRFLSSN